MNRSKETVSAGQSVNCAKCGYPIPDELDHCIACDDAKIRITNRQIFLGMVGAILIIALLTNLFV